MKTAIYIEDGVLQLVLTPGDDFEKNILRSFEDKPITTKVMAGQFYASNGGYARHQDSEMFSPDKRDRSLVLRVETVDIPENN